MCILRATVWLIILTWLVGCSRQEAEQFPVLSGPYLGQKQPGDMPELFAPGIVATGMYTRDIAMTPDGEEIYYCVSIGGFTYATILYTRLINGHWSKPEVVPHMENPNEMNFEPCISHDGKNFYFLSNRPDPANGDTTGGDQDIWVMDRIGESWGKPYNLGPPVNSQDSEFFPSLTREGTLYFTRSEKGGRESYIYRALQKDGVFREPEKLGPQVNSGRSHFNAFVAPDESYIIVPVLGREDSYGSTDYYISFRNEDDTWIGPFNLGDKINTSSGGEHSAYVSPDGKYLFFMSRRASIIYDRMTYQRLKEAYNTPQNGNSDIYWISTAFIADLKASALRKD
jgi:hypothetical protein